MRRELRILAPGDEAALERFLASHADTTMFLRGNLREAGLVDRGEPFQCTYAAAFEEGAVVGVAGHSWGGNLLLEAPVALPEVARLAAGRSGRAVTGLVGRYAQVCAGRAALGLEDARTSLDSREQLMALDLDALCVPEALASGRVRTRAPRDEELELLHRWRMAYEQETLGTPDGAELESKAREMIELYQREGRHWVLEADGEALAYTAFNARLPDCVQVGGVFTPPDGRGRGRARAAVAGSLLEARAGGATRSLLFTQETNRAAQAAYRALGYERVGDYGLLLFAEPQHPR